MKSTEMQTLGALCMHGTANWWAGRWLCITCAVSTLVTRRESEHRLATSRYHAGVDTHPLLLLLVPPRYTERTDLVAVSQWDNAYWLFRLFSLHISWTQSFQGKHHFQALVVLKPLVSPIGHLVACSAWIAGDKQTHTQTKYCNPHLRVNYRVLNHCAQTFTKKRPPPLNNYVCFVAPYRLHTIAWSAHATCARYPLPCLVPCFSSEPVNRCLPWPSTDSCKHKACTTVTSPCQTICKLLADTTSKRILLAN